MSLLDELKEYQPFNEQEEKDKQAFITFLEKNDDAFYRTNLVCHVTASSFIVNKNRTKTLFGFHNLFQSWTWLGGHADGDENLLNVSLKEAQEEAGIKSVVPVLKRIYSVELLHVAGHIKKGEYVPSHVHLNVTYLLEADENEKLTVKEDENSGLSWFTFEEAMAASTEEWMNHWIFKKLIDKLDMVK